MDKKLSIEVVRLKAGIAKAINDTEVPACVVAMVLNEYLVNVNALAQQQYMEDLNACAAQTDNNHHKEEMVDIKTQEGDTNGNSK